MIHCLRHRSRKEMKEWELMRRWWEKNVRWKPIRKYRSVLAAVAMIFVNPVLLRHYVRNKILWGTIKMKARNKNGWLTSKPWKEDNTKRKIYSLRRLTISLKKTRAVTQRILFPSIESMSLSTTLSSSPFNKKGTNSWKDW